MLEIVHIKKVVRKGKPPLWEVNDVSKSRTWITEDRNIPGHVRLALVEKAQTSGYFNAVHLGINRGWDIRPGIQQKPEFWSW